MSHRSIRSTLAAVAVAATALATGAAAPAAHAAPTPSATLRTAQVDVDGDLKGDTVTLRRVRITPAGAAYALSVRTATGKTASTSFVVADNGDDIENVWGGTTGIDGNRGAEIIVTPTPVGDALGLRIYRWAGGRLVVEAAPDTTGRSRSRDWVLVDMPWGMAGYTFYSNRTGRYVVHHAMTPYRRTGTHTGVHTTYRWNARTATWVRTGTHRTPAQPDAYVQQKYAGFFGVEVTF